MNTTIHPLDPEVYPSPDALELMEDEELCLVLERLVDAQEGEEIDRIVPRKPRVRT